MAQREKRTALKGSDLDEIAVQSLRCRMSMCELTELLQSLNVKYTQQEMRKIRNYRQHVKRVTRSFALGY